MRKSQLFLFIALSSAIIFISCEQPYAPKPRGYFRIELPPHEYRPFDPGDCPFVFEVSQASEIIIDTGSLKGQCWFNIDYPRYKATFYLSYRPVTSDLEKLTEDCRQLAMKHVSKAAAIDETEYSDPTAKVYGLFYDLKGNSASPLQFWITDSTRHFLRGSLYFYAVPNADSVAPVLGFVKEDLQHMVESFRWK